MIEVMATILFYDLQARGVTTLTLADCEAIVARLLDRTSHLEAAIRENTPLMPRLPK